MDRKENRLPKDAALTINCALAFGGNSAASETCFHEAISALHKAGIRRESFAETIRSSAMGADAGQEFLNSAGIFQTDFSASELLNQIHKVETELGRIRTVHWGPRPIDIDVVFFGDQVIDTSQIVIPHPCAWYRSFVLNPLSEIAADWVHPTLGESVRRLKQRVDARPQQIEIQNAHPQVSTEQLNDVLNDQSWQVKFRIAEQPTNPPFHPLAPYRGERNHAKLNESLGDKPTDDKTSSKSTSSKAGLFGKIVIEADQAQQRSQPQLETERIIRCLLKPQEGHEEIRQFLKDLEAAILG